MSHPRLGTVPAMRTRVVLRLATVVVGVAIAGHLLMHLQPHAYPGTVDQHGVMVHEAATSSSVGVADATSPQDDSGAHLMAALCMAVLAIALLSMLDRLTARNRAGVHPLTAAVRRPSPRRRRAPPLAPSRIDAGVLLRV